MIFIRCSGAARLANYPTIYHHGVPCHFSSPPPILYQPTFLFTFSSYVATRLNIYIYIYFYVFVCMCVCVCTRVRYNASYTQAFVPFAFSFYRSSPSNPFSQSDSLHPSSSECQFLPLSFSLPPFFPLHLFFIFSQRLSKRLFRVMHRFPATIPSRVPFFFPTCLAHSSLLSRLLFLIRRIIKRREKKRRRGGCEEAAVRRGQRNANAFVDSREGNVREARTRKSQSD